MRNWKLLSRNASWTLWSSSWGQNLEAMLASCPACISGSECGKILIFTGHSSKNIHSFLGVPISAWFFTPPISCKFREGQFWLKRWGVLLLWDSKMKDAILPDSISRSYFRHRSGCHWLLLTFLSCSASGDFFWSYVSSWSGAFTTDLIIEAYRTDLRKGTKDGANRSWVVQLYPLKNLSLGKFSKGWQLSHLCSLDYSEFNVYRQTSTQKQVKNISF